MELGKWKMVGGVRGARPGGKTTKRQPWFGHDCRKNHHYLLGDHAGRPGTWHWPTGLWPSVEQAMLEALNKEVARPQRLVTGFVDCKGCWPFDL